MDTTFQESSRNGAPAPLPLAAGSAAELLREWKEGLAQRDRDYGHLYNPHLEERVAILEHDRTMMGWFVDKILKRLAAHEANQQPNAADQQRAP